MSTKRINVMGMQGDRKLIQSCCINDYPQALQWPHNWTPEQITQVIEVLTSKRHSKQRQKALELLKQKQTGGTIK
jgi:hypothetical protein